MYKRKISEKWCILMYCVYKVLNNDANDNKTQCQTNERAFSPVCALADDKSFLLLMGYVQVKVLLYIRLI